MPDPVLPQIRVTDSQIPEGSAGASAGVDSPSTTTDGGQSQRPKSSTSSEGQLTTVYTAMASIHADADPLSKMPK